MIVDRTASHPGLDYERADTVWAPLSWCRGRGVADDRDGRPAFPPTPWGTLPERRPSPPARRAQRGDRIAVCHRAAGLLDIGAAAVTRRPRRAASVRVQHSSTPWFGRTPNSSMCPTRRCGSGPRAIVLITDATDWDDHHRGEALTGCVDHRQRVSVIAYATTRRSVGPWVNRLASTGSPC